MDSKITTAISTAWDYVCIRMSIKSGVYLIIALYAAVEVCLDSIAETPRGGKIPDALVLVAFAYLFGVSIEQNLKHHNAEQAKITLEKEE